MKALVVYDSSFGNTEALANAMSEALGEGASARPAGQVTAQDLSGIDVLVVGSPTQGGRPTAAVSQFLADIPANGLDGTGVAAFDTRFARSSQNFALRMLMKVIGYAAPRIAKQLQRKGGRLATPPEGFIVEDKEGPLRHGELERARSWVRGFRPTA